MLAMGLTTLINHVQGRKIIGWCEVCEEQMPSGQVIPVPFYSDRDVVTHMASAAHKDRVELARAEEAQRKSRLEAFTTTSDPEIAAHLQKVGKKMLAEGRMVVKPHEKAGM
jgi:hypothetical protein